MKHCPGRRYIDYAAKHGFSGVLIEGWKTGWDGDWTRNGKLFQFTTLHDDFDIEQVRVYAAVKGIKLIGHHETGAAVNHYERQLEEAFEYYRRLGVNTVKTGYVGWGQGIEHIDEDGNILGKEWNAWAEDGGNSPEHTTVLPFTRVLGGPFDFTPGIFNLLLEEARPNNRVNTTLAKQLALYVVIYSPLQMVADLPQNYENQPAFQFIVDVPVDWKDTKVLHAQIGDYVTIARQDRHSEDWYIGSITDEKGRTLETPLTFLDANRTYVAEIYADARMPHWETIPLSIDISKALVDRSTTLSLKLAPGGGQAIRIRPAMKEKSDP